jgi:hypothetical protein
MFWNVLFVSIILVAIAFALLGINMLIRKNGKFPNIHIGGNKELAKRGIFCATTQDKMEQKKVVKVKMLDLDVDAESNTTSC